jgi:mono/diheme cytochrome c family protein
VRHWPALAVVCILLAPTRDAAAQAAPCDSALTTKNGVYTAQQAVRGRDVYAGMCRACHTPESHAGAAFNAIWKGRALLELYAYISERMPKNDPGSLSAQENADVLAYLLRMNRMPAGQSELSADSAALKRIRIEVNP